MLYSGDNSSHLCISCSEYVSESCSPFLIKSTTFLWNMAQYSVSFLRSSSWSMRSCTLSQTPGSLSLMSDVSPRVIMVTVTHLSHSSLITAMQPYS